MRRTRGPLAVLSIVIGVGLAGGSCGKNPPIGTNDASAGEGGAAGSTSGHAGAGGSGSGGTSGSGAAGSGGTSAAGSGGMGAAGSGDGGADAGSACSDKGPACPSGQACDLNQPGRCGASTTGGTCIVKPAACAKVYSPVCGCDGKTYGNDCERQSAGAQLDHEGTCASMACGNKTCGLGQTCVHPCCGGAPPLPGVPPCTPPPPFCVDTRSCSNQAQGNSVCCYGDGGAGCCGGIDQNGLSCLCA